MRSHETTHGRRPCRTGFRTHRAQYTTAPWSSCTWGNAFRASRKQRISGNRCRASAATIPYIRAGQLHIRGNQDKVSSSSDSSLGQMTYQGRGQKSSQDPCETLDARFAWRCLFPRAEKNVRPVTAPNGRAAATRDSVLDSTLEALRRFGER